MPGCARPALNRRRLPEGERRMRKGRTSGLAPRKVCRVTQAPWRAKPGQWCRTHLDTLRCQRHVACERNVSRTADYMTGGTSCHAATRAHTQTNKKGRPSTSKKGMKTTA